MSSLSEKARGQWHSILERFGVDGSSLDGKHRPCPACGGVDRFRFDDKEGRGTHICNQCGAGDGVDLVQKLGGYPEFKTTAAAIESAMGWSGEPLSEADKQAYKAKMQTLRQERIEQEQEAQQNAAKSAQAAWEMAEPATPENAPYLKAKGVQAHGVRVVAGCLVVPVQDEVGALTSLQTIKPDGSKTFTTGGRVGGCYHRIKGNGRLLVVVEGYATGASIHEALGCHVAVAFNVGNLEKVAASIYAKDARRLEQDPDAVPFQLVIGADNDQKKSTNAGLEAAIKAAELVCGTIALPEGKQGASVDWNDIHQQHGIDAVCGGFETTRLMSARTAKERFKDAATTQAADVVGVVEETKPSLKALPATHTPSLQLVSAASIEMERIDWLWYHFLAKGKLHIFAGQAGTGKTTIALALAATVSNGDKWADGSQAPTGSTLIWSGEDDPSDSLIPRLAASGANLEKIFFIGEVKNGIESRSFDPASDMPYLLDEAEKIDDLALIIVDPIVSAVSGDSHKNADVRKSLQPLVNLGLKVDAAILGITHFTKGSKGGDPAERVTGSLAFGALARMVMCTVKPQSLADKPRFIRAKSNISPDGGGFEYELRRKDLGRGIEGQYIKWGGALEGTASELMAAIEDDDAGDNSAYEQGVQFLQDILAGGQVPTKEVNEAARANCHAVRTIERARKNLGIEAKKIGKIWFLRLPNDAWIDSEKSPERGKNHSTPPDGVCGGVDAKTGFSESKNPVIATKKATYSSPPRSTPPTPLGGHEFRRDGVGFKPSKNPKYAPQKKPIKCTAKVGELGCDGRVVSVLGDCHKIGLVRG